MEKFAKVQARVDEKCQKMREIQEKQQKEGYSSELKNVKRMYKWRVWKNGRWELIYKPYPPKDKYYEWQ